MEKIKIETMQEYHYLSNLNAYGKYLLYIDSEFDMANNDYLQTLHRLDPTSKEDIILHKDKHINYTFLDDKLIYIKNNSDELIESEIYDENMHKLFTLPLDINHIETFSNDYYYVEASIDLACKDYYKLDEKAKVEYHKNKSEEKDYLILDEYPFFFNGVGFINGKRNNAFLVNKKDLSIKLLTPSTMNVEGHVIIDDKLYLLANDYSSMKKMWSSVYLYDINSDYLNCIYDNKDIYISKIVNVKDEICVLASIETCIYGKSFYRINNGKLELLYRTESMFYNSIATDCHYGKIKNNLTDKGILYILNTKDERSLLNSFDGVELKDLTSFEGAVIDFTLIEDNLYIIALKDMQLEEIYLIKDQKVIQLTNCNKQILDKYYIAKPERLSFFNLDEIRGFVLKPYKYNPNKKYPMILDIHGGPKTAYGHVYFHEMQVWASMGYFVAYCNPHCSDGRGDAFTDYLKHYGATDYDDLMLFTDEVLKKYPSIDKDKLCVTGGSYGGYMTNWIITHTDRFKAAVSQRSISNRVSDFYYSDYSYDTTYENGIVYDQKAIELFWDRSPLKYVENVKTPTLFIQSTEDYRCPFPEAIQLFSALKWKGVETRICGFKGENHELSRSGKPKHRIRRLKEISEWMQKHID